MKELIIESPVWSDVHFTYIINLEHMFLQLKLTPFKNFIKKIVLVADDERANEAIVEECEFLMGISKDIDKKLYTALQKKYDFLVKVGIADESRID